MEWKILMITLKNITDCDLRTQQLVLGWRNKPRIRMMMTNQDKISIAEHSNWLHELKKKQNHIHYIVFDEAGPFGVAEIKTDDEFGIYIGRDSYLGKGYGKKMMEVFLKAVFETRKQVWSTVKKNNKAAIKIYKDAGFYISQDRDDPELLLIEKDK